MTVEACFGELISTAFVMLTRPCGSTCSHRRSRHDHAHYIYKPLLPVMKNHTETFGYCRSSINMSRSSPTNVLELGFLVDDAFASEETCASMKHLISMLLVISTTTNPNATVWFVNRHNPMTANNQRFAGGFTVQTKECVEDVFNENALSSDHDLAGALAHILTPLSSAEQKERLPPAPLYLIVLVNALPQHPDNITKVIDNISKHLAELNDTLKIVFAQVDMANNAVNAFLNELQQSHTSSCILTTNAADAVKDERGLLYALARPLDEAFNPGGE
jgi:hypothetical protein